MSEPKFIDNRAELFHLAPVASAPLTHHVLVCQGKSCAAVGSSAVRKAFDAELRERNILQGKEKKGKNPRGNVVVTDCGSVGLCAVGVAVMVYPAGVWYAQVRAADVPEIVERHLINGEVVERLALIEMNDGAPSADQIAAAETSGAASKK